MFHFVKNVGQVDVQLGINVALVSVQCFSEEFPDSNHDVTLISYRVQRISHIVLNLGAYHV